MALELVTPFTKVELETEKKILLENKLEYLVVTSTRFIMHI